MIHTTAEKAFLGSGLAFPIQPGSSEALSMVAYEEDIRQAIRIILGTNPGERVMRPDFGAGLNAFLFEPINTTTLALVENQVRTALITWEARIDLEDLRVTYDRIERTKIIIDVHYRVRATNSHHNLVYPFYLQEGTSR